MPEIAYVNGEFCDLANAKVSVEDRGFQFADGVYEVIVAPGGRLFRLRQHLERLKRSADAIGLAMDWDALGLPETITEGVRRCGFDDVMAYVQITRGAAPRTHVYADSLTPTVVATFKAKPVLDPGLYRHGVSLETVQDIRWARCYVKSIALLPNVLIKNDALRRGFFDAIIIGPGEEIRETTSANIFLVSAGVLRTPPTTDHVLCGVTRGYLLECASKLGIPCKETDIHTVDLTEADEVFLSSTSIDVMPVTSIDGRIIGTGLPGEMTTRLRQCFTEMQNAKCKMQNDEQTVAN